MHTKIRSTCQLINMELKQNLLKIEEKKVVGITKNANKSILSTFHHRRKAEIDEVENKIVD